jgi:N-glycosylase/DNA lyase
MNSDLVSKIKALKRSSIRYTVDKRLVEFESYGQGGCNVLFGELCFCILTANYAAEPAIQIQKKVGNGFITLPERILVRELKRVGYRFPNIRASYITEARKHHKGLKERIRSFEDEHELRGWLVKNVKGLGMKEASHFLRNIGFKNLAIIDFHIVDILVANRMIKRPNTLTPKKYAQIEAILINLGGRVGMNMAELDLYLWYLETGKILK